jgi:hypothetical protein
MTTKYKYLIDHGAPDNRWQVMLVEPDGRLFLLDTYETRAQAREAVRARLMEEKTAMRFPY